MQDYSWNDKVHQIIAKGAGGMRRKLKWYAKDYLPGGKYWDPPEIIQTIQKLKPSNDIILCESILGLNDWLHEHSMHSPSETQYGRSKEKQVNKSIV